uniref:Uncharacterized protein n=1 Tax=Anguilla anguilla TaxID=7936 RepID=A0A0E9SBU2_ANGAN
MVCCYSGAVCCLQHSITDSDCDNTHLLPMDF